MIDGMDRTSASLTTLWDTRAGSTPSRRIVLNWIGASVTGVDPGAVVVGAAVVGGAVVGTAVVGAAVVGTTVVGSAVVGAAVVGTEEDATMVGTDAV